MADARTGITETEMLGKASQKRMGNMVGFVASALMRTTGKKQLQAGDVAQPLLLDIVVEHGSLSIGGAEINSRKADMAIILQRLQGVVQAYVFAERPDWRRWEESCDSVRKKKKTKGHPTVSQQPTTNNNNIWEV